MNVNEIRMTDVEILTWYSTCYVYKKKDIKTKIENERNDETQKKRRMN